MDTKQTDSSEIENKNIFMYGLCHVLARALVAKSPVLIIACSWGHIKNGTFLLDHAFALNPINGHACDIRGWFENAHELIFTNGISPIDDCGNPMQWATGNIAEEMIEQAIVDGKLTRSTVEWAILATENATDLLREIK